MKIVAAALLCLYLAGCAEPPSPAPPAAPTAPPAVAVPTPPTPVPASAEEPVAPGKDAEPLPDPPKADPANTHKPLTADKTLLLEVAPDPADAKKTKPVRLLVQCEVCLREGTLEVFLCRTNTKEHEAIVRTAVDAKLLHGGLLALGLTPGTPVQFIDPKSGELNYVPASGPKVAVTVHYRRAGQLHTHPAQEWITDAKTKKPMAHDWVFAGSRFLKDPDEPTKAPFYTANNGEVIAVSNFADSMLDLPVSVSRENAELNFDAATAKVPPLLSKVWVILAPAAAKK